jgi:hypothetical protein
VKEPVMIVTQKSQRRIKIVNQNNNKKPIVISAFLGLVLSLVLCFTQNIESMLYFSGAPLYIDSFVLESEGLVSIITFIYFIGLFSLIGYLLSIELNKLYFILICISIIIIHLFLVRLEFSQFLAG